METQATTRLLLALWDLGGAKQEVRKGELTKRIVSKTKKIADYQSIFNKLQQQGAIAISKSGFTLVSPKGLEVLGEGLKSPNFKFEGTIVGTWTANALLKWISQTNNVVISQAVSTNGVKSATPNVGEAIASYNEFKPEVLKLFDELNITHSYGGLIPIWHLRNILGKQVNRENFNNWMMTMQEEQLFYLQSGEARGATEDQKRNSIESEIRGLLFFASKPS